MIDWRAFWATYFLLACVIVAAFLPQRHPVPTHRPPTPTIVMEHR